MKIIVNPETGEKAVIHEVPDSAAEGKRPSEPEEGARPGEPEEGSRPDSQKGTKPMTSGPGGASRLGKASSNKPRDISEDDDGYHPYADGPQKPIEYERDPWA